MKLIIFRVLKIMSLVFDDWRRLAVDAGQLDLQLIGVDLVGSDEVRPERGELVRRLAEHPLAAHLVLEVAGGEVVTRAVAGDV